MRAADNDSKHHRGITLPFDEGQDVQVKIGFICSKFQPALTAGGQVDQGQSWN